jgi:hypothetical protein
MRRFIIIVLIFTLMVSGVFIPETAFAETVLPSRVMSIGSQGLDVKAVQETLNQLGYTVVVDGIYGQATKLAILGFQSNYTELTKDGVYGPSTRTYLIAALAKITDPQTVPIPAEENVNDNLTEDKSLTYDAGVNGLTNIVPQYFVDANRDKLKVLNASIPVIKEFNTAIPADLAENPKYDRYSIANDYLLVLSSTLNVRELPTTESKIVRKILYFDKVNLIQEVKGQLLPTYASDSWYRIFWHESGVIKYGYVFSKLGEPRAFRLSNMFDQVKILQKTVIENKTGYISNYKNINGYPLAYKGTNIDAYGNDRSQSAPGYTDVNKTDFRYFPDGTIVSILEELTAYYKVSTPSFDGVYFIPKKYVSFKNHPLFLKKVIVIDETNQNEGVFEFTEGRWELISYIYATTGAKSRYAFETPKGHFMAIEKKPYFLYLKDGTSTISGFAPYSTRFSGGGYIHGVPVDFKTGQNQLNTSPTNPLNFEEFLFTIGTTPRSHKCVRNYTSHAKFVYEWVQIGSTAVIVIK